ncbi:MAG: magnesium transporter CorA family protein [Endomicrobium sp.]|jgi:magnesium transporter|nr:magnesium transporter CorA family protein [Endomicrobium sp.]
MIKAIYLINNKIKSEYDVIKITEVYNNKNLNFIWIDINLENHELSLEETRLLYNSLKFHEMAIEDCLFPQYYPKIEEFTNYMFGAIHGIELKPTYFNDFEDSIYELNFFFGKNFIVTVHTEELLFLETLFENTKVKPLITAKSIENMLYSIFNKVIYSYELILDKIDDKLECLEENILTNPESTTIEQILNNKKVIFLLKKTAESQQAVYTHFTRKNNNFISKESLVYFRDTYIQYSRVYQSIIMRSQMVVNLLDVYMSSVTLRLTEIMKLLTIIATIVMPILIVSGYYGMNLSFPEYIFFGKENLWFFAVFLMLITIIIMFIYFKRKKWL